MAVFWLSVAGPGVRTGVSLVALLAGGHGQTWTRDPDKMPAGGPRAYGHPGLGGVSMVGAGAVSR